MFAVASATATFSAKAFAPTTGFRQRDAIAATAAPPAHDELRLRSSNSSRGRHGRSSSRRNIHEKRSDKNKFRRDPVFEPRAASSPRSPRKRLVEELTRGLGLTRSPCAWYVAKKVTGERGAPQTLHARAAEVSQAALASSTANATNAEPKDFEALLAREKLSREFAEHARDGGASLMVVPIVEPMVAHFGEEVVVDGAVQPRVPSALSSYCMGCPLQSIDDVSPSAAPDTPKTCAFECAMRTAVKSEQQGTYYAALLRADVDFQARLGSGDEDFAAEACGRGAEAGGMSAQGGEDEGATYEEFLIHRPPTSWMGQPPPVVYRATFGMELRGQLLNLVAAREEGSLH